MKNIKVKLGIFKQYEVDVIKTRDYYKSIKDFDSLKETNIKLKTIRDIKEIFDIKY